MPLDNNSLSVYELGFLLYNNVLDMFLIDFHNFLFVDFGLSDLECTDIVDCLVKIFGDFFLHFDFFYLYFLDFVGLFNFGELIFIQYNILWDCLKILFGDLNNFFFSFF